MTIKTALISIVICFISLSVAAQGVPYNHAQQMHENIQNGIKGTLDGFFKAPQTINNNSRPLVFPRNSNNNFSVNPWSNNKLLPQSMPLQRHNDLLQGNPWAPIGAPNLPFDRRSMMPPEKNPYTDAPVPRQYMPSSNYSSMPFSGFQNQFSPFNNGHFDPSRGSFSSPFGDNFFPGNQFMPGINNGNGSMPFMPW